jgi:hypothetical protein
MLPLNFALLFRFFLAALSILAFSACASTRPASESPDYKGPPGSYGWQRTGWINM